MDFRGMDQETCCFRSSFLSPMLYSATWRVAFWYSCIQSFHRCAWKGNKSAKQNLIHRRRLKFFKDRGPVWAQRLCREPFLVFCPQSIRKRTTGRDTCGTIQNFESNDLGLCLTLKSLLKWVLRQPKRVIEAPSPGAGLSEAFWSGPKNKNLAVSILSPPCLKEQNGSTTGPQAHAELPSLCN